jgi:hypothetical protein
MLCIKTVVVCDACDDRKELLMPIPYTPPGQVGIFSLTNTKPEGWSWYSDGSGSAFFPQKKMACPACTAKKAKEGRLKLIEGGGDKDTGQTPTTKDSDE